MMNVMHHLRWIAATNLLCSPGGDHGFNEGPLHVGAMTAPGATFASLSDVSSSKCPPLGSITFVSFKPEEFRFVTTVPDKGEGKAGGWQEAKPNLEFKRLVIPTGTKTWTCSFTIGMPLRPELMGRVDARRAARMSVEVTESVGRSMDFTLPQGIFCHKFVEETRATFKLKYPDLGATVTK